MIRVEPHYGENLAAQIVMAVAEERCIDPYDVEERLGDVVDIEALERMAWQAGRSDRVTMSVTFTFAGCVVTVRNDVIQVVHPDEPTARTDGPSPEGHRLPKY